MRRAATRLPVAGRASRPRVRQVQSACSTTSTTWNCFGSCAQWGRWLHDSADGHRGLPGCGFATFVRP
eukprot:14740510-Heterocapsa_arctica.AAC.1